MLKRIRSLACCLLASVAWTCTDKALPADPLFVALSPDHTHITFANRLASNPEMNIFSYRHFYNGGGVALGDVNNDGLADMYLTANTRPNKLYLNKGRLQFADSTAPARVAGSGAWSTGVTMADVNGDGRLDIYVCHAGEGSDSQRKNELFINQGNTADGIPTFTEQARTYGLDDEGYGTHATFFDYDSDGDLEL